MRRIMTLVAGAALNLVAVGAEAQTSLVVEKKVFELPSYTTQGGSTIKNVRIGWESYGTLNAEKSNAILVTHFFSGTSHAAGKYRETDAVAGYWDPVIGPGKAIDTDKYFVISSDTLVNLNANTPNVVTTGPASVNPDTGKPYGMSFPVVSFRDFVNVQKALLDSLGIQKLKAVVGASMGALQAFEWAAAYPERVERIVPVIGAAGSDPFLIAWLDVWGQPIRLDPKWNGGDYYGKEPPNAGLTAALKVVSLHANQAEWATQTFGDAPAASGKPPKAAFENQFKIQATLDQASSARATGADANNMLYLIKANQLADVDPAGIKVPTLLISSPTDLVFPQARIDRTATAIASNGTFVERATVTGPNGHLNGVLHIQQAGPVIANFLGRSLPEKK
jgi:homoserine O-acetyltransferase